MYTYESQYGFEIAAFTRSPRPMQICAWNAPTFDSRLDAEEWIRIMGDLS